MTEGEVAQLEYFSLGEKNLAGRTVNWAGYDFETMLWLDRLRRRFTLLSQTYPMENLRPSITVIRGGLEHGNNKLTAVDGVSAMPFAMVFQELCRLPRVSWGAYEGGSWHIDRRSYVYFPARWIAFRNTPERAQDLQERGLSPAIEKVGGSWIYIVWSHPLASACIEYLHELNA